MKSEDKELDKILDNNAIYLDDYDNNGFICKVTKVKPEAKHKLLDLIEQEKIKAKIETLTWIIDDYGWTIDSCSTDDMKEVRSRLEDQLKAKENK